MQPLGKVLFAYSGAIQPVIDAIDSPGSLLEDVGADRAGGAYSRDDTRLEPHNLATSTAALYSAGATFGFPLTDPPPPYFDYGRAPLGRLAGERCTPLVLQPGRDHMDLGGQVAALVQVLL